MSITHQNEKSIPKERPAWGLNTNSLEDWLENDVKQSSLFHSRHKDTNSTNTNTDTKDEASTKCSLKQENTEPTIKIEQEDDDSVLKNNEIAKADGLPPHLIPIMKVYSLLNSIRQNEQLVKERQHSKKRLYAMPPPPSPILSVDSEQPTTCQKKKRGNSRGPVDMVVKRQRNTDAARRSRLRKAIKMETLEKQVDVLKTDNERLRVKVAVLETEVTHATEKEQRNRQRVLELEAQLAIAHKQLVEEYQK
jgi:hypothetical protein